MAGQVKVRVSPRRKPVETAREAVSYSTRISKTWPWVPIALAEGLLSTWILSLIQVSDTSARSLAVVSISMLVQTLVTYLLIIGPARSWLRGESVVRSAKWVMSPDSLAAWTLPVLLGVGIIFAVAGAGFIFYNSDLNVIATCVVVLAVANGMRRLYKTEYVEITNPRYKEDAQSQRRSRRVLSILFGVAPHQLQFPLLQSIIAVVIPSLLIVQLAVSVLGMSYNWATALATTFVPLWGIAWAEWNLRGGVVRLLRLGNGRPLNPALKPVKTLRGLLRRKSGK